MLMLELSLVSAGMGLFVISLVLFVRVYLLVEHFVEAIWVRCCWWALGLLVVLFQSPLKTPLFHYYFPYFFPPLFPLLLLGYYVICAVRYLIVCLMVSRRFNYLKK